MNKTDNSSNVVMVVPEDGTITRKYIQRILSFARLGKGIRISPKSNASINAPGFKMEFTVESVNVLIGIGTDYSADLTMELEAWKALKRGEPVTIDTTQEFKKKYK